MVIPDAPDPADPRRIAARTRLAEALRRTVTVAVGRPMPVEGIESVARQAEALADAIEGLAGPGKATRVMADADGHRTILPTGPMTGIENPLAPPARVWIVEGTEGPELRGSVHFGYAYEGPPTCVHGGALAALFDELLGSALVAAGRPGMTGTLTVRYRRPTPLQADLDLVARGTTVQGRKIGAWAGAYHEGELTAEAEGIFIAVDPGFMASVVRANDVKADAPVVDDALRALMDAGGPVPTGE